MASSARGPFRPGTGAMPPYLAGREAEQALLRDLLADLSQGTAPGTQVILYGPRGNGKTVLLGWLQREATRVSAVEPATLQPAGVPDEWRLRELILPKPWWDRLAAGGVGIAGFSGKPGESRAPPVAEILAVRAKETRLLLLVDEAHTLDLEVGRSLLNASQKVGAELPFLLVLAGTPNLESHLAAMGASFWNRAEQVRVSRLRESAAAEAFRRPLEDLDIAVSGEVLAPMVRESQCYPFFVQVLGQAVWRVISGRPAGSRRVTRKALAAALPQLDRIRSDHYRQRYRELRKHRLLEVGAAVAEAFRNRESLSDARLDEAIGRGLGPKADMDRMDRARETLSDLGFVWEPGGEPVWEPGIPSLMDYVRKFAPAPPGDR